MDGGVSSGDLPRLGTDRFRLLGRIGEGGMGVGYAAHDREQNRRVALKMLRTVEPRAILRLKHEFRALRDLVHPNLVAFGELFEVEGDWFFTMEMVEGSDFLTWVRGRAGEDAPPPASDDATVRDRRRPGPAVDADDFITGVTREVSPRAMRQSPTPAGFDEGRLRRGLVQIARGLVALHDAEKVHCDIKPSNVLVTDEERVVILDFGLVSDLLRDQPGDIDEIAGTLAFMAPEQTLAERVGPAADWYAVGAMLYLALTGRVPLRGDRDLLFQLKRSVVPEPPRTFRPDVPPDLDALCMALLRIDPRERPTGREVLRVLGGGEAPAELDAAAVARRAAFVGRHEELVELRRALAETRRGQTVIQLVHGESGVGKSTLVRHFTEHCLDEGARAIVLAGPCYERESLPFKAVDEIVDDLSRHLKRFSDAEAAAILPRMASLLTQVFPVLLDVEAFARAPRALHDLGDPRERRRRVFVELRALFARLADRHPLVLVIDDLQWADADSLALLSELVRPPEAPALLLLATVRDGSETGRTHRIAEWWKTLPGVRHLHLHNLPSADTRRLVGLLAGAGADGGEAPIDAATIVDESQGHPLFIDALVRHRLRAGAAPGRRKLEDALWSRILGLDALPRRLVELVAVAVRPLVQAVLARAAGADPEAFAEATAQLRQANLVRADGLRATDLIEPYHERVRVAVRLHLDAAQLEHCHHRLALALESTGSGDLEAQAAHWHGAGDHDRSWRFAMLAAEQAGRALAFDRAARLYQMALELRPLEHAEERDVRTRLAEALANAGRSAEAAEAFRHAAARADGADAIELQRRVAEQLLISGHIDAGLAEIHTVLRTAGLKLPASSRGALASLLFRRAWVRLRGAGFRARAEQDLAPSMLKLIDLTFSLSQGLVWVDAIRGAEFQTRHVLLALAAGEPYRLARALAIEGGFAATAGGRGPRRAAKLFEAAQALAAQSGRPHALGFVLGARGFAALAQGQWRAAIDLNREAEAIFAERCTGVPWELALSRTNLQWGLANLGALRELARVGPGHVQAARDRGDLFAATSMVCGPLATHFAAEDAVARGRVEVDEAMARWSQQGFHLQHLYALVARGLFDLYDGAAEAGYARLVADWPGLRGSYLMFFQITRIMALDVRARLALMLAMTRAGDERARLLAEVASFARRLRREGLPFAAAMGTLFLAGHAAARGAPDEAVTLYARAAEELGAAEMGLHATAARWQHGRLLGGIEGRTLVDAAERALADEGVRLPARLVAALAPGPPPA
jgi:tetratricopeptide (TPR) repeat protein